MKPLFLLILALLLSANLTYAAWELPTATPPNGNPDVPVNTGTVAQTKSGDLTVTTNINTNSIWTNLFRLTTNPRAGRFSSLMPMVMLLGWLPPLSV